MTAERNSLTDWIHQRNSSDKATRDEAARQIVAAFKQRLLAVVEPELPQEIRGRVDAEDVIQSAFKSLFRCTNDFSNSNAMFAYLKTVALHKADNIRKKHCCHRRDARREVHDNGQLNNSDYNPGFLDGGKKPVYSNAGERRAYHQDFEIDPAQLGSDDSFIAKGTVERLLHNWSSNVGVIMLDLIESLRKIRCQQRRLS